MAIDYPIHIEIGANETPGASYRAAGFLILAGPLIFAAGFYFFGADGMLDINSRDFIPVPHALSALALVLGIAALVRAVRSAKHTNAFGKSILDCNKPVLGGALSGTLTIEKSKAFSAPIALRLHCDWKHKIRYEDGENSKPAKDILWEQSQELPSGGAEIGVPFRFAIPVSCVPSGWRAVPRGPKQNAAIKDVAGPVIWYLTATSQRSGVDYLAEFEIRMRPENSDVDAPDNEQDEDDFGDYNVGEKR